MSIYLVHLLVFFYRKARDLMRNWGNNNLWKKTPQSIILIVSKIATKLQQFTNKEQTIIMFLGSLVIPAVIKNQPEIEETTTSMN